MSSNTKIVTSKIKDLNICNFANKIVISGNLSWRIDNYNRHASVWGINELEIKAIVQFRTWYRFWRVQLPRGVVVELTIASSLSPISTKTTLWCRFSCMFSLSYIFDIFYEHERAVKSIFFIIMWLLVMVLDNVFVFLFEIT